LVAFRAANALQFPQFFNGAVPPFGDLSAQMLVVGLAPGLQGANATGRPFTGDYAGEVLYAGLKKHGLASGEYDSAAFGVGRGADNITANFARDGAYPDGFALHNVRITNAVRCVPPENKPTPDEEKTCNPFLLSEIAAMPNLKIILSLGLTSHQAVLRTFKLKARDYKFAHGALHSLDTSHQSPVGIKNADASTDNHSRLTTHDSRLLLLDSYHTSRYNVSTGRLTQAMFDAIVAQAKALLAL
jgi:uracil-DNA glycosylase